MEYEVRTQDGSVYYFSNLTNAEEFAEGNGGEVRHRLTGWRITDPPPPIGPEEEEKDCIYRQNGLLIGWSNRNDEGPPLEAISEVMRILVKHGRVDVAWCDEHNDFVFIAVEGEA